ncbi:hypothetical protein HYH03_012464 [Edaphochlamys debaryana]|uniref:Uncharacterized protein n=1 Tax=Edaphochlamys debaryana TaxID=47281 RepID=A0A836BTY1_9CHLO|nr:hypothetical protein HYH03_012464 [Edaphochlamys debaryana]|eukprot:KAG2489026.1 hypothetical protein HYH03_012464 [Edaphochlamys debaryana]
MNAYIELSAEAKKTLKQLFKHGDKDGDHAWSRKELKQFLKSSWPNAAGRLEELWSLVDADGDESLDFEEVRTLIHLMELQVSSCGLCQESIYDDAMWACRTCCTQHVRNNGNMGLTPDEWVAVCEGCCDRARRLFRQSGPPFCPKDPSHALERVPHNPFVNLCECPLHLELSASLQPATAAPAVAPAAEFAAEHACEARRSMSGGSMRPAWSFEVPWDSITQHSELAAEQGGFAEVYQAMYKTCTRVALKQLKRGSAEELRREYEFMRSLPPHEHVVLLYGITTEAPTRQPWLVMAWYPCDLQRAFLWEADDKGPATARPGQMLTPSKALDMAWELAMGLQFLHSHNMVHRDVKPDNVLLTEDYHVKITDFGISGELDPEGSIATEHGHGSPLWMAPELTAYRGDKPPYTNKVDVYAWGVIFCQLISRKYDRLYELLHPELITLETGMGARDAHNRLLGLQLMKPEELRRIPSVLLPKLTEHLAHLPPALSEAAQSLLKGCLSVDPGSRPDMDAVVTEVGSMRLLLKAPADAERRAAPPPPPPQALRPPPSPPAAARSPFAPVSCAHAAVCV